MARNDLTVESIINYSVELIRSDDYDHKVTHGLLLLIAAMVAEPSWLAAIFVGLSTATFVWLIIRLTADLIQNRKNHARR